MELTEIRKELDTLDASLVKLFEKRMALCGDVAAYKKEHGLPVLDEGREREKLSAVAALADPALRDSTKMLYQHIFDISRAYQNKLLHPAEAECKLWEVISDALEHTPKVFPARKGIMGTPRIACQGTWGAYSQHAADRLFGKPEIFFVSTFESVFNAVEKGLCDYGIVPAENNTAGSVRRVYDLMTEKHFRIVRSIRVKIDHALLALPTTKKEDIREIVSHEQALAQCADYIEREYPGAKVTSFENTAKAAEYVAKSERGDLAAIGSPDCAKLFGLSLLCENMQITDNNRTRFFCISKKLEIYPGADRTSMMLRIPHEPGSLYRVLSRFNAHGINLTKLESRPIPSSDFTTLFCFELETSVYSEGFAALIRELSDELGDDFRYLGSFSEVQ